MNYIDPENIVREAAARDLGDKIANVFKKFSLIITITHCWPVSELIVFPIKLKGNTREEQVRKRLSDVQTRLKLPKLELHKKDYQLYLVVSDQEIKYDHLPTLLGRKQIQKHLKKTNLPYIIGYDYLKNPVVLDLANIPHLLIGGSTDSGKTVGIKVLITCLAATRSPAQINFVIIDVGATNLTVFEGLPHNAYPIVRDRNTAYWVLVALQAEMEKRIKLEAANPEAFRVLPQLVLVIDEFPALFIGVDSKKVSKAISETISSLLQRGRHAKIHVILAGQNPTIQNMRVDLGNITSRIAFRCAKENFSEVILGEGGAENLSGQGSLLLKAPWYDGLQQVQGVFITPDELQQLVQKIKLHPHFAIANKFTLTISERKLLPPLSPFSTGDDAPLTADDALLAQVVIWAVERETISANLLMNKFKVGWNRATRYMRRLEEWNLVDAPDGKQARRVRVTSTGELSKDLLAFMERCGFECGS